MALQMTLTSYIPEGFYFTTPWGPFAIGYLDGVLLWIAVLTVAAVLFIDIRKEKS